MTRGEWILLANASATLGMAGVIWVVQLVHYPAFGFVEPGRFETFERFHQRRISLIVVPLMFVELSTALLLLWERPAEFPLWAAWTGAALAGLIWLSTLMLQVPLHRELTAGLDARWIKRLVATNWIRTVAWTARAGLVFWALALSLPDRA
jgi:hypothetical protein